MSEYTIRFAIKSDSKMIPQIVICECIMLKLLIPFITKELIEKNLF